MLIWSGWGFLAAIVVIAFFLGAEAVPNSLFGEGTYQENPTLWQAPAMLLAGVVNFLLGRWLNGRPGRTVIDKETREEITLRNDHTLFFVKVERWGLVLIALGPILLVVGLLQ